MAGLTQIRSDTSILPWQWVPRAQISELYNNNEILGQTGWEWEDDLCGLVVKNNNMDLSTRNKLCDITI